MSAFNQALFNKSRRLRQTQSNRKIIVKGKGRKIKRKTQKKEIEIYTENERLRVANNNKTYSVHNIDINITHTIHRVLLKRCLSGQINKIHMIISS